MNVAIITLNWNGWKDTVEFLDSIYGIDYDNYDVILVDNGSTDGSLERIREYCRGRGIRTVEYTRREAEIGGDRRREKYLAKLPPDRRLRIIVNERNYGFAMGNNIAIRYALKALKVDYVAILNNDTVVDPGFLRRIVEVMEERKDIGVAGPKVFRYDRPDSLESMGGTINVGRCEFPLNFNDRGPVIDVDYVSGCCMVVRREVFERVGMFDPIYFCYVEEIDFCYRVKREGYRVAVVSDAKIWHKGGRSSEGNLGYVYNYHRVRNRMIFAWKHAGLRGFLRANPFIIKSSIAIALKARRAGRMGIVLRGIAEGFLDGLRVLMEKRPSGAAKGANAAAG